MSLALAIKNATSIVVGTDVDTAEDTGEPYGQFVVLANRSVLLITGNTEAIRAPIIEVLSKVDPKMACSTVAQLIQAELTVQVVPELPNMKGRVEIIVAGFNPIRHREEPELFYMDSAADFYLAAVPGDSIAAGSTAAVSRVLAGHSFAQSNTHHLRVLAKECLSATKLRWPAAVKNHVRLAVLTAGAVESETY
jgi:hypothetical protein